MLGHLFGISITGKDLASWFFYLDHHYGFMVASAFGLVLSSIFYGLLWMTQNIRRRYARPVRAR